jgi:hypothetical protein
MNKIHAYQNKRIKGNAWVGLLILLVFMITLGLALITEVIGTITQSKKAEQVIVAQALCDAGVEKAFWKLNQTGGSYAGENNLALSTGVVDISVTNIDLENKEVLATAYVPNKTTPKATRSVRAKITVDLNETNVSFRYGVQVGTLGLTMSPNGKVLGNVYVDGPITGGQVTGDAISSGPSGLISGTTIGNDAKAHTIGSSSVGRDAYYSHLSGTSVVRTKYPGSADSQSIGLPIAQPTIDQWESWAEAGGIYSGNYTIQDGAARTLGPIKINGDLTVTNNATLTITGVIWVTGNINFSNNAIVKLAPSFGANSGIIIADSLTNKTAYGKVNVSNNVVMQGSGNPKSYVMVLSTNTGSTTSNPAIAVGNNSDAVVYYATAGMVEISNNAHLRAVSGAGLHLSNNAEVTYDSGLADANFSGGPGGSWQIKEWQIVY